jgi:predicted nucleotidyltransferase
MLSLTDLFPKSRAAVLRLLFGDPSQETHLRDLARAADLSPAALQRELTSLAAAGILLSRRDGNRHYFRAATSHPLYSDLHGLVSKTTGIAPALQKAIAPLEGVDLAFIFGSTATGKLSPHSDVDLLIIGSIGLRQITPSLRPVSLSLSREINPHCITPAEWLEKKRSGDAFVHRVAKEPKLWLKGDPDVLASMDR